MDNVVQMRPPLQLLPILPEYLDEVIEDAVDMLVPAIARQSQNVDVEDILDELHDGDSLLWMAYVGREPVAAIVTGIVQYPKRRNMKIEWMGGKRMHTWVDEALAILTKVAKEAKLDAIEADGRKGFQRKYAEAASFREIYTHFEMELS